MARMERDTVAMQLERNEAGRKALDAEAREREHELTTMVSIIACPTTCWQAPSNNAVPALYKDDLVPPQPKTQLVHACFVTNGVDMYLLDACRSGANQKKQQSHPWRYGTSGRKR